QLNYSRLRCLSPSERPTHVTSPRLSQEAVRRLDAAGDALGRGTGTFQSRLTFVLQIEGTSSRRKQTVAREKFRQGQALHSALSLRGSQPARTVRHEAERSGGNPRGAEANSVQPSWSGRLRALARNGQGHGSRHRRAVHDASLSDSRR